MPTLGLPVAPTFPSGILDLQADLMINGVWTSVTPYIYSERQKPTITRGRADESSSASASSCAFQFNNRDNRFSMHNPLGPYYPYLGRNTPFRMHIPEGGGTYLRFEDDNLSNASTPFSASFNLPGDLEARIDLNLSNWTASTICGQWKFTLSPGDWAWQFVLNADGTLGFWYTTDGSTINIANSTQPMAWPGGRCSLKVTYAHSSGAVSFYYASSIDGSYSQLGNTVVGPTGVLFASDAFLVVGANTFYFQALTGYAGTVNAGPGVAWKPLQYNGITGKVYEFRLYNGIAGTQVASPKWTAQTIGITSFTDAQGNIWTNQGTATIVNRKYRFHGEMGQWPPRWDYSGNDVYIDAQANGLLRRLQQNTPPLDSALTRAWKNQTGNYAPVAYWPCEDGNNVPVAALGLVQPSNVTPTQIASGLPGGRAMTLEGKTTTPTAFASDSSYPCSYPIPTIGTQTWQGSVPPYTLLPTFPAAVTRMLLHVPSGGDTNNITLLTMKTWGAVSGAIVYTNLSYSTTSSGELFLTCLDDSGNTLFTTSAITGVNGQLNIVDVSLQTSGGNVVANLNVLPLNATTASNVNHTFSSSSVGRVTQVIVNPNGANIQSALGQIAVQIGFAPMDSATSAFGLIGPFNAWFGETAGLRYARLCSEEGFAYRIIGPPSSSVTMGPQTPENLFTLLQECEQADHGMMFEPRQSFSLGYRCYNSIVNQTNTVSSVTPIIVDYDSAHLGGGNYMAMEPTDDDLLTINDETVTRSAGSFTGSSFEATLTADQYAASSALCISNPPNGVGEYSDARNVNVQTDAQLGDQAAWIVHQGTVNELRYPSIPFDFARSELQGAYTGFNTFAAAIQELDIGDFLQFTTPPPWLSYDNVKTIIWGYSESMGGYIYNMTYQTQPESLWEVGQVATSIAISEFVDVTNPGTLSGTVGTPI